MSTIHLNKKNHTIKIVNRHENLRLQHTGKTGPEGSTPYIENNNWFIDGVDTGVTALGSDGAPGTIVAVQSTAPLNPNTGDLWVDTSV